MVLEKLSDKYSDKEYYDKHKTINIYTLNDERKYERYYKKSW